MRLWNTYSGDKSPTEVLQHSHEVLCVAIHPTGRFLAAATLNGEVHFWDSQDAKLTGVIEVRAPTVPQSRGLPPADSHSCSRRQHASHRPGSPTCEGSRVPAATGTMRALGCFHHLRVLCCAVLATRARPGPAEGARAVRCGAAR